MGRYYTRGAVGRLERDIENKFSEWGDWGSVSPTGGGDEGGGVTEGGYLFLLTPEHSCTVHYDKDHYGPVSGSREAIRFMGGQAVFGAGSLGIGGDADGRLGGRKGGWGGDEVTK